MRFYSLAQDLESIEGTPMSHEMWLLLEDNNKKTMLHEFPATTK